jgi:hypothetical protein
MPASEMLDTSWTTRLLDRRSRTASMEVGVHPGYQEPWRDAERRAIMEFAIAARAAGHELIGWRDL